MHVKELDRDIDRKQLLLRQIDNGYIEKDVANKEIAEINERIASVTQRILAEESEKLKTQIKEGTKKVFTDGDFKRTVARILIDFLERMYDKNEVKGIMRQGYKLMRQK